MTTAQNITSSTFCWETQLHWNNRLISLTVPSLVERPICGQTTETGLHIVMKWTMNSQQRKDDEKMKISLYFWKLSTYNLSHDGKRSSRSLCMNLLNPEISKVKTCVSTPYNNFNIFFVCFFVKCLSEFACCITKFKCNDIFKYMIFMAAQLHQIKMHFGSFVHWKMWDFQISCNQQLYVVMASGDERGQWKIKNWTLSLLINVGVLLKAKTWLFCKVSYMSNNNLVSGGQSGRVIAVIMLSVYGTIKEESVETSDSDRMLDQFLLFSEWTPQKQFLPICRWPHQQGQGPPLTMTLMPTFG